MISSPDYLANLDLIAGALESFTSGIRNLIKATRKNLQKIENDIELVRSMPYDFSFRQKHINTLRELIDKQQTKIRKYSPQDEEREALIKQVVELRRKLDRASEKRKGTLFKRLAPAKKKAYN